MKLKNNTYYTKQERAIDLISKLKDFIDINSYDIILEPSAGSGIFLKILKEQYPSKQVIALDIFPQHKDITKQDFLTYSTEHIKDKNILTISNPPFSPISLLNNFLKKIFSISSVVAIILPSSFKNNHRQNLINPYFHLIYSYDIPTNSYEYENTTYNVKTIFNVYIRKDFKHTCNIKEKPNEYYQFVKCNEEYDFIIVRVGCKCSEMYSENIDGCFNDNNSFFIKIKSIDAFKILYDTNKYILDDVIKNSVGQKNISKQALIRLLNSITI